MTTKQRLQTFLALALGTFCTLSSAVEEGDVAPDFNLPSIYADKPAITMAGLKGKTVYIDFWASWCAPCLTSLPLYNELYHQYKDQAL